jgi:lipid II:glycine glycyltransferase (peptidoglycan interpeptide bridge formation enzyme)
MSRRRERGEDVPMAAENPQVVALVRSEFGEFFQAVREGTVLSSMLVIRSRTGAYYHSAGTSPEGMELGASHFLVYSVAQALQQEGLEVFNLGGAEIGSPGLRAFKSRFGTIPVETEAVRTVLCGTAHRIFVELSHRLRQIGRR